MQIYNKMGTKVELPDLGGYDYLMFHLQKMGFASNGAMGGYLPLSFQEIDCYIRSTEAVLSGDEVLLIREMSENYCRYVNDKNPQTKSPFKKD